MESRLIKIIPLSEVFLNARFHMFIFCFLKGHNLSHTKGRDGISLWPIIIPVCELLLMLDFKSIFYFLKQYIIPQMIFLLPFDVIMLDILSS